MHEPLAKKLGKSKYATPIGKGVLLRSSKQPLLGDRKPERDTLGELAKLVGPIALKEWRMGDLFNRYGFEQCVRGFDYEASDIDPDDWFERLA